MSSLPQRPAGLGLPERPAGLGGVLPERPAELSKNISDSDSLYPLLINMGMSEESAAALSRYFTRLESDFKGNLGVLSRLWSMIEWSSENPFNKFMNLNSISTGDDTKIDIRTDVQKGLELSLRVGAILAAGFFFAFLWPDPEKDDYENISDYKADMDSKSGFFHLWIFSSFLFMLFWLFEGLYHDVFGSGKKAESSTSTLPCAIARPTALSEDLERVKGKSPVNSPRNDKLDGSTFSGYIHDFLETKSREIAIGILGKDYVANLQVSSSSKSESLSNLSLNLGIDRPNFLTEDNSSDSNLRKRKKDELDLNSQEAKNKDVTGVSSDPLSTGNDGILASNDSVEKDKDKNVLKILSKKDGNSETKDAEATPDGGPTAKQELKLALEEAKKATDEAAKQAAKEIERKCQEMLRELQGQFSTDDVASSPRAVTDLMSSSDKNYQIRRVTNDNLEEEVRLFTMIAKQSEAKYCVVSTIHAGFQVVGRFPGDVVPAHIQNYQMIRDNFNANLQKGKDGNNAIQIAFALLDANGQYVMIPETLGYRPAITWQFEMEVGKDKRKVFHYSFSFSF